MTENIKVLFHSSIRIQAEAGVVYADPFKIEGEPKDADIILVTHDHYDHFSPEDIGKISKEGTVLAVPVKMADKAGQVKDLVGSVETVEPGKSYEIKGLKIETVPAYNVLKPFHPKKAGWVGYIIVDNDTRIYIAGDTDVNEDIVNVSCDIALVPIGGTYTMDAKAAANLVNMIAPELAIPTHYGSIVGTAKDAEKFVKLVDDPIKVEVQL
ncbi:MAG: MBL fold metallo-hydrolase [Clostridiales bacterium]|nr:MBL fold metallo-hydrolase [Clostridiales bacterium]